MGHGRPGALSHANIVLLSRLHGVILVFDVNERDTFVHLQQWLEELELYSTFQHTVKLLVGNKIDVKQREVSVEEAETFARKQAMMYIQTSAKTREGIRTTFEEVVQKILDTPQLLEASGGLNTLRGTAGLARDEASYNSYCSGYC